MHTPACPADLPAAPIPAGSTCRCPTDLPAAPTLRFHGRIFFSKLRVEVIRIWQPEDGVIKMR